MKTTDLESMSRGWLEAAAAGDRSGFERLYRHFQPQLLRFVLRGCGRPHLAEEVVNEALWVVWRSAGNFRGDSRVSTWVHGIAYRCMLRALRDRVTSEEINASALSAAELAATEPSVEEDPDRELRDWVGCGLASLPIMQRLTVELAYYQGETCEDIARIMECSTGTVKARLMHARLKLRKVLPVLGGEQEVGQSS